MKYDTGSWSGSQEYSDSEDGDPPIAVANTAGDENRDETVWVRDVAEPSIGLTPEEESRSARLKDRILRSKLCRQPEGKNMADEIIVEEVMTAAQIEADRAALHTAVPEVEWSAITVTTDSSSDLE